MLELFGIERVQPESVEAEQRVNQRPATLLQGDGERMSGKPLLPSVNPVGDLIGILIEGVRGGPSTGFDDTDEMLLIGPVDADDQHRGLVPRSCRSAASG